jgi:two-component system, OmpR family, response regulator ResD
MGKEISDTSARGALAEDFGPSGATVLVIEDEVSIQRLVRLYLEQAGYRVLAAGDGQTGIEMHARERADLIVLDLMLPVMDGWEVCRRIRAESRTPILMLTARRTEDDRVHGLDLGADDYLTKPFSPRELVSRVRAILRRAAPADSMSPPPERITFPGLTIVPAARRVEVDGRTVELTAKEFDLLLTFARSPDYVFSREELFSRVWGFNYLGDSRTVDVHVGTLRKKLEREPGSARFIKTVWRVGYKLDPAGIDSGEATS